ncbi:MAG: hypothetical protein ABR588_00445 [Sphingomicrobium sp.]|nr:hypothetical protein [Sphingomonadales bacterium]
MSHRIEWRHDGRRILVPVAILAPYPSTDLAGIDGMALLDTGSTTSGVSERIARKLSLPKRGKRPIASIQGEGQAERFQFRVGIRAEANEPSFPYVFDELTGFGLTEAFAFEALLGMDVLGQCDFDMDRHGWCAIEFGR